MSRVAFAAAHVAAGADGEIDWKATLDFRRHLWHHGLGVAEAMDTAQRGMGLDWPLARELIRRTAAEAGGRLAAGAGTDHAEPTTIDEVRAAYEHQCEFVEGTGAQVIVMASRALAAVASSADDYREVYGTVLRQLDRPAIMHWLGEMFDPALAGYWGDDPEDTLLAIVGDHADKVDGIKVSLLDAEREVAIRERLPEGVRLYTGDDFNYPELIASGSDALLGIFAAIAPAAAAALAALERGDRAEYDRILAPTVPLARKLFEPPTFNYKAGIAYLAWLNGHQEHFRMLGGMETARSAEHLAEVRELAEHAGVVHP
jgi:dihydrodipicolinate synthase/N-acetylneuraminate lyase